MRKFLFCAILIWFMNTNLFSQQYYPIPKANAIWNIDIVFSPSYYPDYNVRYGLIGDTLINDTLYSKIYYLINDTNLMITNTIVINTTNYDTIRRQNLLGFLREDSNKHVYFRDTINTEMLLYNFSKNIGDTLTMKQYWLESGILNYSNDYSKVLTNIDSVFIINDYRKRFVFDNNLYSSWTEGIGISDGYGLLAPIIPICLCYNTEILSCLKYNDTVLVLNNPKCDHCFCSVYTNINLTTKNNNIIELFPNPISSTAKIKFDRKDNEKYIINISNSLGQLVWKNDNIITNEIIIQRGLLVSGIYFIELRNQKEIIAQKKIIIE